MNENAPAFVFDGWRPGAIAGIVGLHARYYAAEWGFGEAFEAKVANELGLFAASRDPGRDLLLTAWDGGELAGSIVIDSTVTGGDGAHLRWFIVSDGARGSGLGGELMRQAMAFCDRQEFGMVWLTTFRGLEAARRLYESSGFRLVLEAEIDQWSGGVTEQRFERRRAW